MTSHDPITHQIIESESQVTYVVIRNFVCFIGGEAKLFNVSNSNCNYLHDFLTGYL